MTIPAPDALLIERLRWKADNADFDPADDLRLAASRLEALAAEVEKYETHLHKVERALMASHLEVERLKGALTDMIRLADPDNRAVGKNLNERERIAIARAALTEKP